ncbi:hypothetical protein CEXT_280871 [Caerostris extrusa]|uniref:Uncharacterized protein n=1 Tax=Caerostris extrusa TaxID=172846 RepID=A0AAV4PG90_CAEEX|nr:hypothetical protein CEXT_280871 [Caerostris extrusa]
MGLLTRRGWSRNPSELPETNQHSRPGNPACAPGLRGDIRGLAVDSPKRRSGNIPDFDSSLSLGSWTAYATCRRRAPGLFSISTLAQGGNYYAGVLHKPWSHCTRARITHHLVG